jgi:GT-D fold-like domain
MSNSKRVFGHYRPINTLARRVECERVSNLMVETRPFSFLRLGDMELAFLIASQQGCTVGWQEMAQSDQEIVSSTAALGHPGLKLEHASRLQTSYERCSYLDFHDGNRAVKRELPKWKCNRAPGRDRNPGAQASELFLDWLKYEFFKYVQWRRCLFVGAEAGILRELLTDPIYRRISANYWPTNVEPVVLVTGRIGADLDRIKDDISRIIRKEKIDTAFISLGGAAKILCYELAEEHNIATFDFGSLIRGLTYSGSDGHSFVRATHYPYYFRVPFDVYMAALHRAMPGLPAEKILAKAHAQLALELIRKEEGWTWPSEWVGDDCLDLGRENRRHFWNAYAIYLKKYKVLAKENKKAAEQVTEFDRWRKYVGLGLDGKLHRMSFNAKVATRKTLGIVLGRRWKRDRQLVHD